MPTVWAILLYMPDRPFRHPADDIDEVYHE
jgi:hypothetical protein